MLRRPLSCLAMVPVLLSMACGGDDGTATTTTPATTVSETTATPAVDTSAPSTSPDTTTPDTTTPDTTTPDTTTPDTTATTDAPTPSGADCVVGDWLLQSQDFFDQVVLLVEDSEGVTFEHVSGEYRLTLGADGTGTAVRDAWTFRVQTPEGGVVNTIESVDTATFAIDGSTMTYEETGAVAEVTIAIEVDGELVPLPVGAGRVTTGAQPYSGSGPYTCSDNELTITITDELGTITARWDRS